MLDAALTYLMASSISMPLQALYATSTGIMRAAGDSRTPMFASLLSDIAYIAVASLCIYTLHMGVLGAGLGLAASRLVSSGIAFTLLIRGHGAVVVPRLREPEARLEGACPRAQYRRAGGRGFRPF